MSSNTRQNIMDWILQQEPEFLSIGMGSVTNGLAECEQDGINMGKEAALKQKSMLLEFSKSHGWGILNYVEKFQKFIGGFPELGDEQVKDIIKKIWITILVNPAFKTIEPYMKNILEMGIAECLYSSYNLAWRQTLHEIIYKSKLIENHP